MEKVGAEFKNSAASSTEDVERDEKAVIVQEREATPSDCVGGIDLYSYHEKNAGRLVLDPEYAHISQFCVHFK